MNYGTVFQTIAYKDGYTRVVFNSDDIIENPGHQKIDQDLSVLGDIATSEYLQTIVLVSSEAISVGDLVSLSGPGTVAKSRMDNEILSKVIGVSRSDVESNQPVKIAIAGQLVKGIAVHSSSPSLSYGDTLFLSLDGSVSSNPPTITGSNYVVEIGVMVNGTGPIMLFSPKRVAF